MIYQLRLLNCFVLLGADGQAIAMREPVRRLLALLALRGRQDSRTVVAATLWSEVSDRRARANLRSIIWRCHREIPGLIEADEHSVLLAESVSIDYLDWEGSEAWFGVLLPGWDDDWLCLPRLLHRQVCLQLVEDRAAHLIATSQVSEARRLLTRLLQEDPLRRSAGEMLARVADARTSRSAVVTRS